MKKSNWSERWDEKFIKHRVLHGGENYARLESLETSNEIKSFISQEIAEAEDRGFKRNCDEMIKGYLKTRDEIVAEAEKSGYEKGTKAVVGDMRRKFYQNGFADGKATHVDIIQKARKSAFEEVREIVESARNTPPSTRGNVLDAITNKLNSLEGK